MDGAHDAEAVLRLGVVDRVAAGDDAAAFGDLGRAAAEDFRQDRRRQVFGKADDVEGEEDFGAHGVDVAHGVGGGDGAVGVGVIDDGREEVERQDDRKLIADAIDSGVVKAVEAEEQVGVLFGPESVGERAQDLRQEGDARLSRSAGAGGEAGEADLFSRHRRSFCAVEIGSCILRRDEGIIHRLNMGATGRSGGNLFDGERSKWAGDVDAQQSAGLVC